MVIWDENKRSGKKAALPPGNVKAFGFIHLSTITNHFRQGYCFLCRDLNRILHKHKSNSFWLFSPLSPSAVSKVERKYYAKYYLMVFLNISDEVQGNKGSASCISQRVGQNYVAVVTEPWSNSAEYRSNSEKSCLCMIEIIILCWALALRTAVYVAKVLNSGLSAEFLWSYSVFPIKYR